MTNFGHLSLCRHCIQINKNVHVCFPTWCQRARLKLPDHMTEFSLQVGPIGVFQCHEHVLHINNPITLSIKLTKGLRSTNGRDNFFLSVRSVTQIFGWGIAQKRMQTENKRRTRTTSLSSSLKPVVHFTYINTLEPACESFVLQMKASHV